MQRDPNKPDVFMGDIIPGVQARVSLIPEQNSYAIKYHVEVFNQLSSETRLAAGLNLALQENAEESGFLAPPKDHLDAVCLDAEEKIERQNSI